MDAFPLCGSVPPELAAAPTSGERCNCDGFHRRVRWSMIGSLSLDQLRVLVAIADEGSFSAAGRSLSRAQSVVSQTIANLEAVQGVALFD